MRADVAGNGPFWIMTVCITLIALYLRVHYVFNAGVQNPFLGDAGRYFFYAWNLIHRHVFSGADPDSPVAIADSYRDPAFPAMMAVWIGLFSANGQWYWATLLTQAIIGALTVTELLLLARAWLPPYWLASVGILAALWPHSIAGTGFLLTEILFGFLLTGGIWLIASVPNSAHPRRRALLAGLSLGLATLTNSVLLPFPVLIGLFAAWKRWLPGPVIIVFLVAASLLPFAWAARNLGLPPGQSASNRLLINLDQGSWPGFLNGASVAYENKSAEELALDETVAASQQRMIDTPLAEVRLILRRLAQSPLAYARWYLLDKPSALWSWSIKAGYGDIYVYYTRNSPFDTEASWRLWESMAFVLNPLLGLLACLFSLLCVANLIRRPPHHAGETAMALARDIGAGLLIYVTIVYAVLQSEPRYATPFRSLEIMMAVGALLSFLRWIAPSHSRGDMEGES